MSKDGDAKRAADLLVGLTLDGGWRVVEAVLRKQGATGGTFSSCYLVENGEKRGFLKAFDFSAAFAPGQDTIAFLKALTSAYEHEKEVLQVCRDHRMSKVVVAIGHGDTQVPNLPKIEGRVFYLIFEIANGDVRGQVDPTRRLDTMWSLRALRDSCLGLYQVHEKSIAHQDLKPSNVLVFNEENGFRISDFGRSSRQGHAVWYDQAAVAGDSEYSPPELLYGHAHPDFKVRRVGCDLYMLGNLAAFMFSGINVTAGILSKLDPQFHPKNWKTGTYDDILPYVLEAFTRLMEDLIASIDPVVRTDISGLIHNLCHPDTRRRGHPRGVGTHTQYSLERYLSQLTNLAARAEIALRASKRKSA